MQAAWIGPPFAKGGWVVVDGVGVELGVVWGVVWRVFGVVGGGGGKRVVVLQAKEVV